VTKSWASVFLWPSFDSRYQLYDPLAAASHSHLLIMATTPFLAASVSNRVSFSCVIKELELLEALFQIEMGSPVAPAYLSMPCQRFVKSRQAIDAARGPIFMNPFDWSTRSLLVYLIQQERCPD
jgi:hypothetical protein